MTDRPAQTQDQIDSRSRLVALAKDMLAGRVSFVEGSVGVAALRHRIGSVDNIDEDFLPFVAISSETDHLPLEAQRKLWSKSALQRLQPEFESSEKWAAETAREACQRIIARFGNHDS